MERRRRCPTPSTGGGRRPRMLKRLLAAPPVSLDALNRPLPASPVPAVLPLFMQEPDASPEAALHTVEEVAARLRVNPKTVRRRIRDGTVRTVPIGGRLVRISSD